LLAKDLIDIASVHDAFVKINMRFAEYVRHFFGQRTRGDTESAESGQARRYYYTFGNIIAGELNRMVRDLTQELAIHQARRGYNGMTQNEKLASLLEEVTLRCFESMYSPHAMIYPDLAGKCPITKEPIVYTPPWNQLVTTDER
jgi:hypothetical protein